jgi:hypothetical protein
LNPGAPLESQALRLLLGTLGMVDRKMQARRLRSLGRYIACA